MESIPETMLAAVADKHGGEFDLRKIPVPKVGESQALVKIIKSGVCHTDCHALDGDWPVPTKLPLICGHEGVGKVVAIGSNVKCVHVGDRVAIPWLYSSCGFCEFCLTGRETLCEKQDNSGYSVDGCFAEYTLAEADHLAHIPHSVSYEQAAPVACAGVTTYAAIKATKCRPGEYLTIIGAAGGLGHLATQYAVAMGLRVVALDVGQDKLDFCGKLGAEVGFNALDKELVGKVTSYTRGGSHGVLCLAPSVSAFESAVGICRRGGTIVMVGLPKGDLPLNIFDVVIRGLTVRGSIVGTRQDLKEALDFAARGKITCVTETHPFHEINDIFTRLRQGKVMGRVVLSVGTE